MRDGQFVPAVAIQAAFELYPKRLVSRNWSGDSRTTAALTTTTTPTTTTTTTGTLAPDPNATRCATRVGRGWAKAGGDEVLRRRLRAASRKAAHVCTHTCLCWWVGKVLRSARPRRRTSIEEVRRGLPGPAEAFCCCALQDDLEEEVLVVVRPMRARHGGGRINRGASYGRTPSGVAWAATGALRGGRRSNDRDASLEASKRRLGFFPVRAAIHALDSSSRAVVTRPWPTRRFRNEFRTNEKCALQAPEPDRRRFKGLLATP
jgi:hypothetical protein